MLWKWPKCPNDPRRSEHPSSSQHNGTLHHMWSHSLVCPGQQTDPQGQGNRKRKDTVQSDQHTFGIWNAYVFFLEVVKFFCKGPESKCFSPCGLCGLHQNYSAVPLSQEYSQRQEMNKWAWLCSNKTLFTKAGCRWDLTHRPVVCQPLYYWLHDSRPETATNRSQGRRGKWWSQGLWRS